MNALASWAEDLAQALLQVPLPRRWAHVQGVAERARSLAPVLGADAHLLHAAAWLHDIGYAPGLAVTGLHALDGASYLRDVHQADALPCQLVAHHSYAIIKAGERGLADVLALEFEAAPYMLSSVLTCCDMTTSPDGQLVPVDRRLAEIHHCYGPGHLVSRSIQRATPMILHDVEQVSGRLQGCQSGNGSLLISAEHQRGQLPAPGVGEQPDQPRPKVIRHKHHVSSLPCSLARRADVKASE